VKVDNEPGIVGPELLKALDEAMRPIILEENMGGPIIIEVNGEEDLATLPCIQMLPEGGTVVYGQPEKGLVVVNVDEKIKKKVEDILLEMEV